MSSSTLIIGGGLVGLCMAHAALNDGRTVHLIESEADPRGASWGNAGHLAVEQIAPIASLATLRSVPRRLYALGGALALPPRSIGAWLPFSLRLMHAAAPQTYRAGKGALACLLENALPAWERLTRAIGAPDLIRRSGHFILWESPASAARGTRAWMEADTGTARIRPATPEEIDHIAHLTGHRPAGAVFCQGSGQVADPGALADALRTALRVRGARIETARVAALATEESARRVAALLSDGRLIKADAVIVTAGARSGDLLRPLGHRVPIIDERGYHIQAPVADTVWPVDTPPLVFEDRSMIATRFSTGLRAASFVEFSRAEAPPDEGKWRRLARHAQAAGLPIATDAARWYGSRPTLPDYRPALGRSDRADNLFYAFGHQHLGLTLAATTADYMTAVLHGDPAPPALSLARFEG